MNEEFIVNEIGKRIDMINERMDRMHQDIKTTRDQSIITNSRVNKLEDKYEHVKGLHVDCPARKQMQKVHEDLNIIREDLIGVHFIQKVFKSKTFRRIAQGLILFLLGGNLLYFIYTVFINPQP